MSEKQTKKRRPGGNGGRPAPAVDAGDILRKIGAQRTAMVRQLRSGMAVGLQAEARGIPLLQLAARAAAIMPGLSEEEAGFIGRVETYLKARWDLYLSVKNDFEPREGENAA